MIKIHEEVEIEFLRLNLLSLPEPTLQTTDLVCLPDGETLALEVTSAPIRGNRNDIVKGESTWVLLFESSTWSAENLEAEEGQIIIQNANEDSFCCGVANYPNSSDLFFIATPEIPPIFNQDTLLTYDGTKPPPDDVICKSLQRCTLQKFYDVCIGDEICSQDDDCNWKVNGTFIEDYCSYDGVTCGSGAKVTRLNRNGKDHIDGCELFDELEYLGYLETLDLGFTPRCAEIKTFTCLSRTAADTCAIGRCGFQNITDDDPMSSKQCVSPPGNVVTPDVLDCLNTTCDIVPDEVELFFDQDLCVNFESSRANNVKIGGTVPAKLWTITSLSK